MTNTQIQAISFLPEFACQKWFPKIWALWAAIYKIQSCTLLYLSWLPQEQKHTDLVQYHSCQNLLAKNNLSKSGLPGRLYTNFKAAWSCIYLVFSQEQATHRSMQYYSFQNLHAKNSFPSCIQNSQLHNFIFILGNNKLFEIEFGKQNCFWCFLGKISIADNLVHMIAQKSLQSPLPTCPYIRFISWGIKSTKKSHKILRILKPQNQ